MNTKKLPEMRLWVFSTKILIVDQLSGHFEDVSRKFGTRFEIGMMYYGFWNWKVNILSLNCNYA